MTPPDPTIGARQVAHELARMVARASTRGDLPDRFVQELLGATDHDGALAILLEAGDGAGGTLAPDVLAELAEGLVTSADRVRRSRAIVPLLESLRHHPALAARLLARDEVLQALVGGPRRPRLERALVRVLEAVAPLRAPGTVAAVVRRCADEDGLGRLARGVVALLLESFDELAGLVLGIEEWTPLDRADVERLVARLREDPVQHSRLSTRCAEHGRARMLVALLVELDPVRAVETALARSMALFGLLAPGADEPAERAAYLRVVTGLMRLTGLQLLLAERPDVVPAEVAAAWPGGPDGTRLPVGRLDRERIAGLVVALDRHELLRVPS